TKTSTLTDGDNDPVTDSATANITSGIKVEDDGPVLDINPSTATIALNLDESIVLPTTTTDESGVIAAGSDDIVGVTTVDHINPFGRTSTAAGAVAGLFTDTLVDAGTDGQKSLTSSYTLTLTGAAGGVLANATTFAAAEGVATTLNVTDATNTIVNDNIVLFKISATEIQGRID